MKKFSQAAIIFSLLVVAVFAGTSLLWLLVPCAYPQIPYFYVSGEGFFQCGPASQYSSPLDQPV